jgi:hypothetical protein
MLIHRRSAIDPSRSDNAALIAQKAPWPLSRRASRHDRRDLRMRSNSSAIMADIP